VIVAVAGRRIDADVEMPRRFPPGNVERVRREIESVLGTHEVVAVVCSGACGADLLAADAAARLGIEARIVLPFPAGRFRETSVVDRGGDWAAIFDRVIRRAIAAGDLVVLSQPENQAGYQAANREILDQAQSLADSKGDRRVLALVVWEGHPRGEDDLTAEFLREADRRRWPTRQILTM
jgi:hypothetical protein